MVTNTIGHIEMFSVTSVAAMAKAYAFRMTTAADDAHLVHLGTLLEAEIHGVARGVVDSIRSGVEFYRTNHIVSDDELFDTAAAHLRFAFQAMQRGSSVDTSPASETGRKRAETGVPMTAVMDAFRVGSHHGWTLMVETAENHPTITGPTLLRATERFWEAQDRYTEAMTAAYHERATHQVLENAAEQAALAEALLEGRPLGDHSLWDVAALLQIPARGPYVVIAAQVPKVGKQALPRIQAQLRDIGVFSAWRLLPDLHIGIAHIPAPPTLTDAVELLRRATTTRIGVSPLFSDLADTAQSLRYARVAMDSPTAGGNPVCVFENSVLGIAAVSAPEVTRKIAELTLGSFHNLNHEERRSLLDTFAAWLDSDGSADGAGRILFCHPNTVRNRLRRIEDHTGKSLSNPRELAELCLAFEVAARLGDERSSHLPSN